MMPGYDDQKIKARLLVWWIIWGSILAGLVLIYLFFAQGRPLPANIPAQESLTGLIGLVPLFITIVIRWLVLPRATEPNRAIVLFVVGLALAEGCGFLGIFLGGPYRDSLFVLGLLGIIQYAPFYAKKLYDPKGTGFIPNN
jgi:hypothetical protein